MGTSSESPRQRCTDRADTWAVWVCLLGMLLVVVSTFVERWRFDSVGMTDIEKYWFVNSFSSRTYGLLHVQGAAKQSWNTMAQSMCQYRNYGQVFGTVQAAVQMLKNQDWDLSGCQGSEQCAGGFIASTQVRCEEVSRMSQVSMCTMVFNFIAVVVVGLGSMLALLADRRKTGGLAFGMFILSGLMVIAVSVAWALVTDASFKRIMETAWYPYPELAIGWFLHLYAGGVILIAGLIFGYLVLPEVWNFDPAQEELDEKKRKLKKMQQMAANQQQMEHRQQLQAQNMPLADGQPPYGQMPYPQHGQYDNTGGAVAPPANFVGPPVGFVGPPVGFVGGPQAFGPPTGPPATAYGQAHPAPGFAPSPMSASPWESPSMPPPSRPF